MMSHISLMEKEQADAIAKELNDTEVDGWRYEAAHDPTGKGYSQVGVFDENNEFVGHL